MSDVGGETIAALVDARINATPDAVACSVLVEGEQWRAVTWSEIATRLDATRAQLTRLGVHRGTSVAILCPNQLEWDLVQWASFQLGAQVVGLDSADRPENLAEVIAQTKPVVLVLATTAALGRIGAPLPSIPVLTLQQPSPRRDDGGHAEALEHQLPPGAPMPARSEVQPGDVATTIFTSGTTGQPKGIMYTHRQVVLAVAIIIELLPELVEGDRVPCWLPQAHLFQRIINLGALARGLHVFYVEKPLELTKLLPSIAPQFVVGVPRFFERVWAAIVDKVEKQPPPIRAVARWALKTGKHAAALQRQGQVLSPMLRAKLLLADRLVLSPIRRALGGKIRFLISGAAALPTWLLEEFHGVGLLVLEAYGLSENIVPNAMNTPRAFRFGTVGKPLALTQLRVADDGEICVKGEGLFTGYLGASSGPFDGDGWLPTGDLGAIDDQGFLSIVGRKSEVVKTSTGRKVALPAVEAVLRKTPWVELPVVFALGRSAPVAVLYLNLPRLGLDPAKTSTLEQSLLALVPQLRAELAAVCEELTTFLRPVGVVLVARPPSVETLELTANLKVRRAVVEKRFGPALEAAYGSVPRWFGDERALAVSA